MNEEPEWLLLLLLQGWVVGGWVGVGAAAIAGEKEGRKTRRLCQLRIPHRFPLVISATGLM